MNPAWSTGARQSATRRGICKAPTLYKQLKGFSPETDGRSSRQVQLYHQQGRAELQRSRRYGNYVAGDRDTRGTGRWRDRDHVLFRARRMLTSCLTLSRSDEFTGDCLCSPPVLTPCTCFFKRNLRIQLKWSQRGCYQSHPAPGKAGCLVNRGYSIISLQRLGWPPGKTFRMHQKGPVNIVNLGIQNLVAGISHDVPSTDCGLVEATRVRSVLRGLQGGITWNRYTGNAE